MKLQDELAGALTTGLGDGFRVVDHPASFDAIKGPTVAVWAASLEYLPEAPNGHYATDFTVTLYTAHQDPQRAEDDLATTLAAVLAVIWDHPRYLFRKGERTVSQDNTIHSWTLTVTGGLEITPAED